MTLSQTQYIESLAAKYNLENAKLYDTPMEPNLKLDQASEIDERIKYRNLIGKLLYISTGTRPDISYSVNYLSRYQSCYDQTHYKYAMRILKYLYKTKDIKLTYCDDIKGDVLDCMVDSDYAGGNIDRKSTTGFIIRVYGNVIFWKTHKQNTVTKCSTFAEYTAMSEAVTETLFIKNLLSETFDVELEKPINIYEDNSSAIAIAKFGNFTKNSKHIEVQYHFINENYENGIIDIVKVDSNLNLADMLTKGLEKTKFLRNRNALGLI
ncbi:Copia protein [Cyphomyrmex costatus]|uniref:Copia protein n=1 Tax=Cyphomyrmex costatus TaxID=456900 RepID=A0A151IPE5_9HYME|nr:Copia protein [Cyphomyrmex costatus]